MVLTPEQELLLIAKKEKVSSFLNQQEGIILNQKRILNRKERTFFKQTSREPLTLLRQDFLSKSFGLGGVQLRAKRIATTKRKGRRIVQPRFSKARKEVSKVKESIRERRGRINLITLDTNLMDFGIGGPGIDLSKFSVDTRFFF